MSEPNQPRSLTFQPSRFGRLAGYEDLTICVPWRDNGNPLRSRNLRYVLALLSDLGARDVLLACHGEPPEWPRRGDRVIALSDTGIVEKARLVNAAALSEDTRAWFLQLDADLVYDYAETMARARPEALNLPYEGFRFLSDPETDELIEAGSITFPVNSGQWNKSPGAGSFLIRTSLLRQYPLDETLRGWAGEEFEFFSRVRLHVRVRRQMGAAVHLFHDNDRRKVR